MQATSVPRSFRRYTGVVGLAALVAVGLLVPTGTWGPALDDPRFWTLAVLCVLGELLPINLPRRLGHDEVTISTPFAFAVLITFGLLPAIAVYAVSSLLAELVGRVAPVKVLFNIGQYVLSLVAGAGVLALTTSAPHLDGFVPADLPGILLATAAFFVTNHVLAGAGVALLSGEPVLGYLRRDVAFQTWTAGFQLTLAPVMVVAADAELLLVPLLFFPMLAIYFGGREAVLNEHRALHDGLTDLPNRHLLAQRIEVALAEARATGGSATLLIFDLDEFKAVNDSLGHHLGDLLLQGVARRLVGAAPEGATVARLGGDEFAILLPGATVDEGRDAAQRLLERLEEPFEAESFALDVRGSVGIASFPAHGDDPSVLMKHADLALYRAKRGRTGIEVYAGEDEDRGFDRLALADQLRRGVERGELVLHYQPKLATRAGRPDGVEALVRWQHPLLGLIGPDGFIPLAEQTNLVKPLTRWVLDTALGQIRAWSDAGLELRVSVNLSTRSLLDRGLPGQIAELLARWDLPPAALQLEVTETKIVADFGRARDVLRELRRMGISVAIDDFGTGYSSLAQLRELPADEIKIDKSFVLNMLTSARDAALVRSTIGLGRNLALDVTAEGVETADACEQLAQLGCDFVQGYFIGRPVPAEACEREMRRRLAETELARRSPRRFRPLGPTVLSVVEG